MPGRPYEQLLPIISIGGRFTAGGKETGHLPNVLGMTLKTPVVICHDAAASERQVWHLKEQPNLA